MTISHDTVGAVALDRDGNIAAATSTGGTLNKAPGRLGDSSLIGCGCYADNLSAAVSTTGWGEPIMKLVLAKWTADRISAGNLPEWSAQEAMNYLKQRVNGHGGIIVLNPAATSASPTTPRAWPGLTGRVKKQEAASFAKPESALSRYLRSIGGCPGWCCNRPAMASTRTVPEMRLRPHRHGSAIPVRRAGRKSMPWRPHEHLGRWSPDSIQRSASVFMLVFGFPRNHDRDFRIVDRGRGRRFPYG